jgi:diketogulonate reductase-like aldo/keto reductase
MLQHWPGVVRTPADSEKNRLMRAETWEALEELYKTGKTRAIGVSNYSIAHLEELLSHCTVPPMVNQVRQIYKTKVYKHKVRQQLLHRTPRGAPLPLHRPPDGQLGTADI